jgi:hypothetical protein
VCGPDNRLIETSGWMTRKREDGRTEWIPPAHLDTGQERVNNYHHLEKYLIPDEGLLDRVRPDEGSCDDGSCDDKSPEDGAPERNSPEEDNSPEPPSAPSSPCA